MPDKNQARFRQIYQELRNDLLNRHHKTQQMMPSENKLCQRFQTSRQTIRSALKLLDADGLVSNLPGKGWQIHRDGRRPVRPGRHLGHILFLSPGSQSGGLLYKGINEHAGEAGLSTEFIPLETKPESHNLMLAHINFKDCDGLICFRDNTLDGQIISAARQHQLPLVHAAYPGNADWDTVCGNYESGLFDMVNYAYKRGYRNICFCGSRTLHSRSLVFQYRLAGYQRGCRYFALPDRHQLFNWDHWHQPDAARQFSDWLFAGHGRPCIIGSAGHQLPQISMLLSQQQCYLGIDIGFMLIGTPNKEDVSSFYPNGHVTMLHEDWEALGRLAVERIAHRLQDPHAPATLTVSPMQIYGGDTLPRMNAELQSSSTVLANGSNGDGPS